MSKRRNGMKWVIAALLMSFGMILSVGCAASGLENETQADHEAKAVESAPAQETAETESAKEETASLGDSIILSTTTSTENSGLLDWILPNFTEKTGVEVKVVAVGTGKALQMGRDGEADVLLVHAKPSEEEFVAEGHGAERFDVMYNDFVIIGPTDDPAGLKAAGSSTDTAFQSLFDSQQKFVSRGDDSGTHKKEKSLWAAAGLEPAGDTYISAGKGMGDVIQMADELQAYTMTDRATYLSMMDRVDLEIVVEGDPILFNQYGVIAVDPGKSELINANGAQAFVEWLLSDETQEMIGVFGTEEFGMPLFTPNASK